jgi:hypothetical protein
MVKQKEMMSLGHVTAFILGQWDEGGFKIFRRFNRGRASKGHV